MDTTNDKQNRRRLISEIRRARKLAPWLEFWNEYGKPFCIALIVLPCLWVLAVLFLCAFPAI